MEEMGLRARPYIFRMQNGICSRGSRTGQKVVSKPDKGKVVSQAVGTRNIPPLFRIPQVRSKTAHRRQEKQAVRFYVIGDFAWVTGTFHLTCFRVTGGLLGRFI